MDESDNDPTTEHIHHRASRSPRLVLAALVVGLIAGGIFLTRFGPSGEGTIDPELLRLLERVPFDNEGNNRIEYLDLEVARSGPTRQVLSEDGGMIAEPTAFLWGPQWPGEVSRSHRHPSLVEDAYGYTFEDINQTLLFEGEQFGTFVVIDGDASAALDRATTPPWARQEVRSQIGAFDVLDWGDDISIENRTRIRDMGQTGQFTAFDGDVILITFRRELLDAVLATQDGAPTLAQQQQFMDALELLDYEDSLGFSALIAPHDELDELDERLAWPPRPPLLVLETALNGTTRAIIGFAPDADVDRIETGMRELIGSSAEAGLALTTTVFSRSDDFIVIDITSETPSGEPGANQDMQWLILNIFALDPDLLS